MANKDKASDTLESKLAEIDKLMSEEIQKDSPDEKVLRKLDKARQKALDDFMDSTLSEIRLMDLENETIVANLKKLADSIVDGGGEPMPISKLVNINTASVVELQRLPIIGAGMATKIIDQRNISKFASVEDAAARVDKRLMNIASRITV